MAEKSTLDTLRGISFFHDIADEHLQELATLAREVEYPAQTTIFHEHDLAKDVYVIASGEVSLAVCGPKTACRQMMVVRGGDMMGWSPLLRRTRLSDTAVTLTPVRALAFDGGQLLDLCGRMPEFGFEFMMRAARVLAERLSATRLQLLDVSGVRLPEVQIESD